MFRAIAVLFFFIPMQGFAQSATTLPLDDIKKEAEATGPSATVSTPLPDSVQPEKKEVERVEVTGSHIKRMDTEGASPVETITRKELERSGYNSVADVLRDNTTSAFGGTRETTNSSTPGNAEVDLRGLGSDNTLVLLNGQRLPTDAVSGAVDLNMIPMAAVERVEILKDGASAIYGSDALGGVVNIITRKDFTGSEVNVTQTTPEQAGGQKNDISLVNGFNSGRLNMINVVQYRDNQQVFSRDRSWSNNGVSEISNYPSYSQNNGASSVLGCPPDQIKHTPNGDVCTFKYSDYSTELPDLKQVSVMSDSNIEVSSKVKMEVRLGGTERQVHTILAPAPGIITLPAAVASKLGPGGTPLPGTDPTQDVDVSIRTLSLGNRENAVQTYGFNGLVGTSIEAGHGMTVDVTAAHNDVQAGNKGVQGYALNSNLVTAISNGSCNPFDPTKPCNLNAANYQPLEFTRSQLSSLDVKTTGTVATFDTGDLGVAVGSTLMYQNYQDNFDGPSVAGEVFGNAGSSGGGARATRAAYAEISIPLLKNLELQVAERYDHYSDFGDTQNPKGALLYHATKTLLFRASAGTGFKAPLMQELYAASSSSYPSFIDHVACQREQKAGGPTPECAPEQYLVTSGGNKDLREEKSVSYSAGTVFEPNKDFNIGTDFFLIRNNNVVGIDYDDLTLAQAKNINTAQYGVTTVRDASGNIVSINAPLQNLSRQEISGLDVSSSYRFHKLKLSSEQSQMFYFKEEGFPGVGYRNKLGENGRPPWRNTTVLGYNPWDRHEANLVAMTTAGQEKMVVTDGRVRNYTEIELMYSYKSKAYGTISVGIKNLMGTTPPLDDSNPTSLLNYAIYNQIGRQYFTGYKQTF